jgi:uncharacterized membrane protein
MIDRWTIATIVAMALMTYLSRIGGYLVLAGRRLSPQVMIVLDAAPGCVLIAVIAPMFVSGRVADLIALGIAIIAAARLPLFSTVLIAMLSAAVMRHLIG